MREVVEPKKFIVDLAFDAMKGSRCHTFGEADPWEVRTVLAFLSWDCLARISSQAGLNFHGRYEFLPVKSLEKSMETIVKIAELLVKGNYTS